MRIRLVVVPPGGGEADYSLEMNSTAVPRVGEYITVMRKQPPRAAQNPDDYRGTEDFIVRQVRWGFDYPDHGDVHHAAGSEPVGNLDVIVVECEFAIGAYSSEAHKRAAGPDAREHEASCY